MHYEQILHAGRHMQLVARDGWEFAHRDGATGIVMIVPVTEAGEFVFVEQYRLPVKAEVIEFPAGLAGDVAGQGDEALLDAARRELREETGYEAASWRRAAHGPPSAGATSEVITVFLAGGLTRVGDGGGDESEQITVHHVPRGNAFNWLAEQEQAGKMIDLKTWAGLYFDARAGEAG